MSETPVKPEPPKQQADHQADMQKYAVALAKSRNDFLFEVGMTYDKYSHQVLSILRSMGETKMQAPKPNRAQRRAAAKQAKKEAKQSVKVDLKPAVSHTD